MVNLALLIIKKLIETAVIVALVVGLFTFVKTPGGFLEKTRVSYQRTATLGNEVVRAGADLFKTKCDGIYQSLGGGISKLNQKKEKEREMELGRSGLNSRE